MAFPYPPSLRLRRAWEFDAVFRTGSRHKSSLVRLLFIPMPDNDTLVGVVVGKRQGNACVRSRGRRVLREAARRLAPWFCPGYRIVFSLSRRGLTANGRDVYNDMASLMKRCGFLTDKWPGPSW